MSEPLFSAEEMRSLDAWAMEVVGIPGVGLMERAGEGLAGVVVEVAPEGPVAVVCGTGNNGGDGFVVARLLRTAGREVRVLLAGDAAKVAGDATSNLSRLDGAWEPWTPEGLSGASVVVDALLGTGSTGAPRGVAGEAVVALMAVGTPVVAADIPSGVDASTGEVPGAAVRATVTATFHAAKAGLWIAPGKQHAGEVRVLDIAIPPGAAIDPPRRLLDADALAAIPRRGADSTKFSSGHVLVCGGSTGLTGAPCLAAQAAARAGAGYVTACVPASLDAIFEIKLTEVMTLALADDSGALVADAADGVVEQAASRGGALVLGPGLGRDEGTAAFARDVATRAPVPLVLDADGLNAFAGSVEELADRDAPTVLSPHGGELARLLGKSSDEVRARRLHYARGAAKSAEAIVVLKGDDTLVVSPDGRIAVSRGEAPALATAGTGDVLSGVAGALLAVIDDPFTAACAAVELHRRAGVEAAKAVGAAEGVIASDVIAALPRALGAAR